MNHHRLPNSATLIATALALIFASAASADETVSQVVPDGGTITSGTTVSADDPVQMTLTVSTGGTVTIVKRTSLTRPAPQGGSEEDTSKPKYLGPRFQISGDATIVKVEVLVDGDSLPPSGNVHPQHGRFDALLVSCSIPGRDPYSCGNGPFASGMARGDEGPDGNLRGELPGVGIGSDGVNLDFAKVGFSGPTGGGGIRGGDSLDTLLRRNTFSGFFYCSLRCTVTSKVFVSRRVQRALGLKSRIIAEDTMKGSAKGKGVNQAFGFEQPLGAGVEAALRRKHVTAILFSVTTRYNGPDGEHEVQDDSRGHTVHNLSYYSKSSRFGINCRVRGISSAELTLAARKGSTTCPDAGQDFEGPPEWE